MIKIRRPEDIQQLEGWWIDKAYVLPENPPRIVLRLRHPVAETMNEISFKPGAELGLVGNLVAVNAGITIESREVPNGPDNRS